MFINIIKFEINIITIKKNIELIWRIKSIIVIVIVIVIIDLDLASWPKTRGSGFRTQG
jgi:hypothetical protein